MLKKIIFVLFIFLSYSFAFADLEKIKKIESILSKIEILKENPILEKNLEFKKRLKNLEEKFLEILKKENEKLEKKSGKILKKIGIDSILSLGVTDKISNGEVSLLQDILIENGYEIKKDGYFGHNTQKTVEDFNQKKLEKKSSYFDPRDFEEKNQEKNFPEKEFYFQKINHFLGYGAFDFFSFDFPFEKEKIKKIYCGKKNISYIFKNGKIILPLSLQENKKKSCFIEYVKNEKEVMENFLDIYFKNVPRKTTKITLSGSYGASTTPQEILDRIYKESQITKKIYQNPSDKIFFDSPFINPMDSEINSTFGKTRIFSNGKTSVHSGTDFRARTPQDIKAINDGKVVLSDIELYYCGKTLIIDHGLDIFSIYCHLSEDFVEVGQVVEKGKLIAKSGQTGRVSGPHLHLSVKHNGRYIDFENLQKESQKDF